MLEDSKTPGGNGSPLPKPEPNSKKRKRTATSTPSKTAIDLTNDYDGQDSPTSSKKKKAATPRKSKDEEKRLRRFRQKAPSTYLEKLHRATTQRYDGRPAIPRQDLIIATGCS